MENKKQYFVIAILVICALSLVVGAFNTASQNIKSEKTKKLQTMLSGGSPKIALVKLNGVIEASENQTNLFSEDYGAQNILKSLKTARDDNSVKAVILQINSPGGTVATSQNIYYEILRVRKNKPVIVVMEDVAASGGYYIASAADRIIAQEGTLTGSIGVIMQTVDAHKLFSDKLGLKSNVMKSGAFKDAGSSTREMTAQERALFQNIVNEAYNQFLTAIENGRVGRNDNYSIPRQNLDKTTLKKYADGRIFTGNQAYNYGFIDMLGDIELAQNVAQKMADEKFDKNFMKLPVVNYNSQSGFSQLLFGASESIFKINPLKSYMPQSVNMSGKLLYLWE